MKTYQIYTTVSDLPESWDAFPVKDIFLKRSFLSALEASSPSNITSYFLGVFSSDVLVGIAIIQRVEMYVDDIFRKTSNTFFKRFGKLLISKIVRGNALIVGNLMHTGQHGFYFNSEQLTQDLFLDTLSSALKELTQQIKMKYKKPVRIIGFKDYFESDPIHNSTAFFGKEQLYKARVQPNMVFNVNPSWSSPQDYVNSFKKKYRSRYKTALKKSSAISRRELSMDSMIALKDTIFKLYTNVSDNAGVNSFKLSDTHFINLKLSLGEHFKMYGYFIDNELIGFYTLILNGEVLETYFLGYNKTYQYAHQMYLNMLFDMVAFGITHRHKSIVFARTAMEIKSSVGAKPQDMYLYVKHTNQIIGNVILKWVVKYANPVRTWEERHPFS